MQQLAFWGLAATLAVGSTLVGSNVTSDRDLKAQLSAPISPPAQLQTGIDLPRFLVFAGGPVADYNEIALEKNVLYFQRTLQAMGIDPSAADIFLPMAMTDRLACAI